MLGEPALVDLLLGAGLLMGKKLAFTGVLRCECTFIITTVGLPVPSVCVLGVFLNCSF